MSKSLLLISQLPEDQEFAAEVAVTAGLPLFVAADRNEGVARIAADSPSVIMADVSSEAQYKGFEDEISAKIGLFTDKVQANSIHFLSSSPLEEVQYLTVSPLFGHFVFRNYGVPKAAGQHYGRIIKAAQEERCFGLQRLLKPGAKIQAVKLQNSSQKQDAVNAVLNYLVAAKFQARMATIIANAVDELLMNAIFDAPADELGRSTLSQASRSEHIVLEGKSEIELHIGYDGTYVGLMAVDHFGSLDKKKLISHISKIYTDKNYTVRLSQAGAGIGLATVFQQGGSFFFASESRTRTEVTVFFRKTENFREFKNQFRFISTQFYF